MFGIRFRRRREYSQLQSDNGPKCTLRVKDLPPETDCFTIIDCKSPDDVIKVFEFGEPMTSGFAGYPAPDGWAEETGKKPRDYLWTGIIVPFLQKFKIRGDSRSAKPYRDDLEARRVDEVECSKPTHVLVTNTDDMTRVNFDARIGNNSPQVINGHWLLANALYNKGLLIALMQNRCPENFPATELVTNEENWSARQLFERLKKKFGQTEKGLDIDLVFKSAVGAGGVEVALLNLKAMEEWLQIPESDDSPRFAELFSLAGEADGKSSSRYILNSHVFLVQEAVKTPGSSTLVPDSDPTERYVVLFKDGVPHVAAGYRKFPAQANTAEGATPAERLISRIEDDGPKEIIDDEKLRRVEANLHGLGQAIKEVASIASGDLLITLLSSGDPAHVALGKKYSKIFLDQYSRLDGHTFNSRPDNDPVISTAEHEGVLRLKAYAAQHGLQLEPEEKPRVVQVAKRRGLLPWFRNSLLSQATPN